MRKHHLIAILATFVAVFTVMGWSVPSYATEGLFVDQHTQQEIRDHIEQSDSYLGVHEEFVTEPVTNTVMGELTEASKKNALATLNDVRYIAGLDPVELGETEGYYAQAAAFVNMSIGIMTHYPASETEKPAEMSEDDWDDGCYGARRCNIAMGYGHLSLATYAWTEDDDASNISRVGHRRWMLNPEMGKTGFGAAYHFYAMYSLDESGTGTQANVAWPAANMPIEYFDSYTPWSLSTGYYVSDENTKVTLTRLGDGKVWHFDCSTEYSPSDYKYFNVDNSYTGDVGCIIFRPDDTGGYYAGDEYKVEITGTGEEDITYTVKFFELDHQIIHMNAKEPTPSKEGNIDCYYCEGCGKYFTGFDAAQEIPREKVILPKIPLEIIKSGECGANGGNVKWTLDNDGTLTLSGSGKMKNYDEVDHSSPFSFDEDITKIVIENGITTIGSAAFSYCENVTNVSIPYSISEIGEDAFYGIYDLQEITYQGSEDDWNEITIGEYNYALDENIIKFAVEHNWALTYTVDKEPTCTEKGSESIHCLDPDCDAVKRGSSREIAPLGHAWNSEATVDPEPTCTQDGLEAVHCARCDAVKDKKVIPAYGHSFGEWVEIDASDCVNSGHMQRTCDVCGFVETQELDPLGHDWEDSVTVDKEPTCTEDGSRSVHCRVCDAVTDSEVIPALGHDTGDWEVTQEATCSEMGSKQSVCARCGETVIQDIPMLEHEWDQEVEIVREPTCKQEGLLIKTCLNCGAEEEDSIPKLTTHKFGGWKTTKAATELAAGQRTRTCSVCGRVEKQTIAIKKPSLPAPTIKAPKAAKKSATVKWKKLSKANQKKIGYIQIQYSTDKKFRTGVKTVTAKKSAASKKITKLTSKKIYYVRIRSYKKSGSTVHISKWSTVKSVKAK